MELAFSTVELRKLCETEAYAEKQLGDEVAAKLRRRLADMRAAPVVTDVVAGSLKKFHFSGVFSISVNVSSDYIVVFCANHVVNPILPTGETDWSSVSRIKILDVKKVEKGND